MKSEPPAFGGRQVRAQTRKTVIALDPHARVRRQGLFECPRLARHDLDEHRAILGTQGIGGEHWRAGIGLRIPVRAAESGYRSLRTSAVPPPCVQSRSSARRPAALLATPHRALRTRRARHAFRDRGTPSPCAAARPATPAARRACARPRNCRRDRHADISSAALPVDAHDSRIGHPDSSRHTRPSRGTSRPA